MANDQGSTVRGGTQSTGKPSPESTGQAPESGEPGVAGRSHGRVIDDHGAPAGKSESGVDATDHASKKGNDGNLGEDFESGRQDAV